MQHVLEVLFKLIKIVRTSVREGVLGRGPDTFIWVQFWRVGWQIFQVEPAVLASQLPHGFSLVNPTVVPQEDHVPTKVLQEVPHEEAYLRVTYVRSVELEIQPEATSPRAHRQRRYRGDAVPTLVVSMNGRLPARCPSPTDGRDQEEPRFVREDDMGTQPLGVFFTRGHSTRFHSSIAASLRSSARFSGFW